MVARRQIDLSLVRAERAYTERRREYVKTGRPGLYAGKMHDELAYDLRILGLSVEQIAGIMKISSTALYEWLEKYPPFADAWSRGGELADAEIARAVFHRAKGYSHPEEKIMVVDKAVVREDTIKHYPPDTAAATFWLTNRQPRQWKSKTETALTGADGQPLAPPSVTINGVIPDPPQE